MSRPFGPKRTDDPSIGKPCPACAVEFKAGDYTGLVALGPGSDLEERQRAREGRPYNAVAIEAHWGCMTGEDAREHRRAVRQQHREGIKP